MAKRSKTRHNLLVPRTRRRTLTPPVMQYTPGSLPGYTGKHADANLIPKKDRRRPTPALPLGTLPDRLTICGRLRDGGRCMGVLYQDECFACGSKDVSGRTVYIRLTDKMSERR